MKEDHEQRDPGVALAHPRAVGPFRILRTLGRGGMGVVYEAIDERLGRHVALKMVSPSSQDRTSRERLRREARTAAAVQHPNVCQVYEVGEADDLYLAMELLDGEPLSARIDRGPMAAAEAVRVASEMLSALGALHAHGVLHRDLKPSNVFLTSHGVKLLDFGLALPFSVGSTADERLTLTGTVLGTPHYMAPERWSSEGEVGPESDLFAVGALLFEMLTGRPAFSGRTPVEVARAILSEPAPSLRGGSGVEALERVVRTSLEKSPRDRYPSASAMALALSEAARGLAPESTATAARSVTRVLVLPFRLLRPDPEVDFLGPGIADAVTTALSGLPSLVMRSAHAGARFASPAPDLAAVAREAGVDVVLVGTLLRAGDRLRATAQLVEAPSGTVLWSDSLDATVGDVLALQDELARRIVESLAVPLSARDRSGMSRKTPATARANELFMRANQISSSTDRLPAARDLYLRCLEDDPGFAPAWARLGRAYRVMSKYGYPEPEENLRLAEEAFRKALSLDPDLSLAHYLYAHHEVEERGRSREAMVRLLGRVRAAPAEADLFAALVLACRFCGLLEASVEADRRARRLDPGIRTSVAYTHWMRGDFEAAIALDDDDMRWLRLYALPLLGRETEAVRVGEEMEARAIPGSRAMVATTRAALLGDRERCVAATEALLARGLRDPEALFFSVRNYGKVGEVARAIPLLERVVASGFHVPQVLRRDPWLDSLRGHPEFERLVVESDAGRRASVEAYRAAGGDTLVIAVEA
jgi:TolB-like protein